MKLTEERLEQAIIELLGQEGYSHALGQNIALINARFVETDSERKELNNG